MKLLLSLVYLIIPIHALEDPPQGKIHGANRKFRAELLTEDVSGTWSSRHLQNSGRRIDYFQLNIAINTNYTGAVSCDDSDLALIGQDLNQVNLSQVSPSDSTFITNICSKPEKISPKTFKGIRALQTTNNGWVWKGGGGRWFLCSQDMTDKVVSDNLITTTPPKDKKNIKQETDLEQVKSIWASTLKNIIIPKHLQCLGKDPNVEITITAVNQADLNVKCSDSLGPSITSTSLTTILNNLS
jgi:hypothetical protein